MIHVNENPMPWSEGLTIALLLQTLEGTDFCSVVRMNGRLISSPQFERTVIPKDATIELLPLVAGG